MQALPINYLAILVCGIVGMVLGFLWFGPLFGKAWMRLAGMPVDAMERAKEDPALWRTMMRGYALTFLACLVAAFVLDHFVLLAEVYFGWGGAIVGILIGLLAWLGFTMPPTLGMVLWEGKPWGYYGLVNAYWVVLFCVMGAILAVWS